MSDLGKIEKGLEEILKETRIEDTTHPTGLGFTYIPVPSKKIEISIRTDENGLKKPMLRFDDFCPFVEAFRNDETVKALKEGKSPLATSLFT